MKLPHQLLRDMREDRNIPQKTIAELIKTSQQQYSKYETGESELPLHAFMILADFYDVSADFLIGRKGSYYNVPGLAKKVTKKKSAKDLLDDILSLGTASREAIVEYVALQKVKENCVCAEKKNKGSKRDA